MSNLYTKTYGSPSNPAILFIHGLGSSSIYFESVIEISNLSENYYLITYDGPGHGQSPLSTNSVTVESLVELAETILAEKGIKQLFGLVGHSLGGLMSLNLAGKLGNRLEKLCLIGPVRSLPVEGRAAMKLRATTIRASGLISIVDQVVASAISAQTKASSPLAGPLVKSLILGTSAEGYSLAASAIAEAKEPIVSDITAETIILHGEFDYLVNQKVVDQLCQDITGNARGELLKGQGHWNCVEDPVLVGELMKKFFAKV